MRRRCTSVAAALVLASAAYTIAQSPDPPGKNDYSDTKNWLCRPGPSTSLRAGGKDACAIDLTTTIVAADGRLTREAWRGHPEAPVDCFYVYPTVSRDQSLNSDMTAGPEERTIVENQLARFGSQCRIYAPLYRQVSLAGLRAGRFIRPGGTPERALAYADVRDAWNHYLQHDNKGRGVVLIGHSQGAFLLADLVRDEIDGKPVQSRLVSAMLLGMNLPVPKGKDVGGQFKQVPLCRSAGQTGCVITYASFRATVPPPADSLFGRVTGEGMEAGCNNPAALGSGRAEIRAYLRAGGTPFSGAATPFAWVTPAANIDTPFVSVPGLLSAQCVSNAQGSYLEVTIHGNPSDPRTDDILGDVIANGQPNPAWGLHLIDVNLTIGNLVDRVRDQSKTYLASRRPSEILRGFRLLPFEAIAAECRRLRGCAAEDR